MVNVPRKTTQSMPLFAANRFLPGLLAGLLVLAATTVVAQQTESVRFDVPAILEACELHQGEILQAVPDERLIEIVLPVSCWISPEDRDIYTEFRFDVHWNRSVYPLVDYSPRTLMQSSINGVVAVEHQFEKSLKAGVDAKTVFADVQPSARLEGGLRNSDTTRYEEIPQHEMLLASGTIHRGTGAFFRYHPSRQFALEGGREVRLLYRVPLSWRGGIMRIVCQADGHRKKFAGYTDPVTETAAFIMPVYLKGDSSARNIAAEYVRIEHQLRAVWSEHLRTMESAKPKTLLAHFQNRGVPTGGGLPATWASDLIQSPLDDQLERDRKLLPASVRMASEDLVAVRQKLVQLSQPPVDVAISSGISPIPAPAAIPVQSAWHTRSPTSVVD